MCVSHINIHMSMSVCIFLYIHTSAYIVIYENIYINIHMCVCVAFPPVWDHTGVNMHSSDVQGGHVSPCDNIVCACACACEDRPSCAKGMLLKCRRGCGGAQERRSQQLEKGLELDLDPATLLAMAVQQQQQVEEQEERWHMSPPVQMPRRQSVHVEQEEQPPLVVVHERHSGFPAGMGVSMVKVTNTSPRTSPRKTHPLVVDPILEGGQTAAADAQEKSAADSHDDTAADSLEDTAADSLEDTAASVELGGDHRC